MADLKLSPMAKLVVAGGRAAFTEFRWQAPLAKAADVSPAVISKLVSESDQRDVTDKTARAVGMALIAEADRLEAKSELVRQIATKILQKLGDVKS